MEDTVQIYDVRHLKEVSSFLVQRKQLYNPDTCLLKITTNKTKGHHMPFMVQMPLIPQQYRSNIQE